MLEITNGVYLPDNEITLTPIRAQGAGGQNVNKVSSAVHLRFDINQSSLPEHYKERLLRLSDHRINKDGTIIIKAQRFRTLEKNKDDALNRLKELIAAAGKQVKTRKATKPTFSSKRKRLEQKNQRSQVKSLRQKVPRPE